MSRLHLTLKMTFIAVIVHMTYSPLLHPEQTKKDPLFPKSAPLLTNKNNCSYLSGFHPLELAQYPSDLLLRFLRASPSTSLDKKMIFYNYID